MSRSYTEEHVVRTLQRYISYYIHENDVTAEEFAKRTGFFEEVFYRLEHARDRGEVLNPRTVYGIWDALGLNLPGVTTPEPWVD